MNPKKRAYQYDQDHAPPITRRDFLSQGLISGFAISMVPSVILGMLKTDIAQAQSALNCPPGTPASGLIPSIVLDMAGGLGLSGNFIVGKKGGSQDLLSSYNLLGMPDGMSPRDSSLIDTTYGAPLHKTLSRFLMGMNSVMSSTTQRNTRILTIPHSGMDDSSNNQLSPLILVAKAGLVGSVLPTGLGMRPSQSGGNSNVPFGDAALKPLMISSGKALVDAIKLGDGLSGLQDYQRARIAKAASNLSSSQLSKFNAMSQGKQFSELAQCGYIKNEQMIKTSAVIDASLNEHVKALYKNPVDGTSQASGATAAAVFNTLMGNVGPSAIVVGGCDYHNQGIEVSGAKDEECGRELGRILELAALLGKPVAVFGISDGAIAYKKDTREPISDSGSRSLAFLACYKPSGPPALPKSQIGAYTDGQIADRSFWFATNPAMVAHILAINYLKICNRTDLINSMISSGGFPSAEIPNILGFG